METRIVAVEGQQLAVEGQLTEGARAYAEQSRSENTRGAYTSDWADFCGWCVSQGVQSLPATAATVGNYLSDRSKNPYQAPGAHGQVKECGPCAPATLGRRLVSISQAHKLAGLPNPATSEAVRSVLKGIRRAVGTAQDVKAPVAVSQLRRMVAAQPEGMKGLRDRALLLVGFAGAFRRSELVGLNREDIEVSVEGLKVTLRRSKTDQEGAGRQVGIPYGRKGTCPVHALEVWLSAAGITSGPLFRGVSRHGQVSAGRLSDRAVALVVKECSEEVGEDPARFGGHSLRAGLATSAAAAGASERSIMEQTGHKSVTMVRRYIRSGSLFRENAAAGLL